MGKKQNMMFVGGMVCAVMIVAAVCWFLRADQNIDTVTAGKIKEVSYAQNAKGEQVDVKTCTERFGQYRYRRYFGKKGNTAQRSFYCYAADDTLLFVITELGNRNLFQVTVNGKNVVYRAVGKKTEF